MIRHDHALAGWAGDLDLAAERQQAGGKLGGGIGEGDRSADRAAVADRGMGDVRQSARQKRRVLGDVALALGLGVAHQRADLDRAVVPLDTIEAREAVDVDQRVRCGESRIERGDEALTAGEQTRAFAVPSEQVDRVVERARLVIGEWRRLHAQSSLWALFRIPDYMPRREQ